MRELSVILRVDDGTANTTQDNHCDDDPPGEVEFGLLMDGIISVLFQSRCDFVAADQAGLWRLGSGFCTRGMRILVRYFAANRTGIPVIFGITIPFIAVEMTCQTDKAADGAVGVAIVLKVMRCQTFRLLAACAGKPMVGFIHDPGVGIVMLVVPCGSDHISADGTALVGSFSCLRAGGMGCGILLLAAYAACIPMLVLVLFPCAVILMTGVANLSADVAIGIAVVIIGMGGGFGNYFAFGGTTAGAGIGFLTLGQTAGLFGYNTLVPGMGGSFFLLANGTDMLMGVFARLFPFSIGVGRGNGHDLRLCMTTGSAGVGFGAFLFAVGLLGDLALVPGVCNSFHLTAERAGMRMGRVIDHGPDTVAVVVCLGNGLGLGVTACSTGEDLFTSFRTGGYLGHSSAVPGVGSGFFRTADGTSMLMVDTVCLFPCAKAVIFVLGHGLDFCCTTIRAGIGLFAGFLAGRFFGDGALIPGVCCFLHSTAICTGMLMVGIINPAPCAERVITLDIDGKGVDRGGNGTVFITGVHIGRNGGAANRSAVFDPEGEGEDLTGNGGAFGKGKSAGAVREVCQGRSAEGAFAADELKYAAVIIQHECC